MAEYSLQLPSRKPAKALLAKLNQQDRDHLQSDLLDVLWDANEKSPLPQPVIDVLCDWIAHAHFEDSPLAQQRIAEARRRTANA